MRRSNYEVFCLITSFFNKKSTTLSRVAKQLKPQQQKDIAILYAFLKSVDSFVLKDKKKFLEWNRAWQEGMRGESVEDPVLEAFIDLAYKYSFEEKWIASYFSSKKFDMEGKSCKQLSDTIWYMYGSAEVIGLMFCRCLHLEDKAEKYAALMGRAIQYLSFLRNIKTHKAQGKHYITVKNKEDILAHIKRFYTWLEEAREGLQYIPYNERVAVMTMADSYQYLAKTMEKDPEIIFRQRIQVPESAIHIYALKNRIKGIFQ